MVTVPRVGSTVPETRPTSVDLPEPFSPTRAWISPAGMRRVASARATTVPYSLRRPSTLRMADCPVVSEAAVDRIWLPDMLLLVADGPGRAG